MFDRGSHETMRGLGPGALGPGDSLGAAPFFGPGFTSLTADGERRTDVDIARSERAEADLDAMITRRHEARAKTEGHRPSEEMYEESVRRYNAQRARERRAEWAGFHGAPAERHRRTLTNLVAFHEAAAQRYTPDKNNGHHEEDSCGSTRTGI
jgi:hypothetical protein